MCSKLETGDFTPTQGGGNMRDAMLLALSAVDNG